jgi:cyclopropane-fatty-acyl-phospholipid synthase
MDTEPQILSASEIGNPPNSPSCFRSFVLGSLSGMGRGRLRLELPEGEALEFGAGADVLPMDIAGSAQIRVRREAFFRKCVLTGDIGFAESYMDGDWTSPDLVAVISWFILNIENAPTLSGSGRARAIALNLLRFTNRLGHALRPSTRSVACRNISEHYDLSNDFFSLFLGPSMMYSSARWSRPAMTLQEAQAEKNERLCGLLRLCPQDHVLEIGTGWGGWALQAAKTHGCRVTTVTLSRQQFDFASRRGGGGRPAAPKKKTPGG